MVTSGELKYAQTNHNSSEPCNISTHSNSLATKKEPVPAILNPKAETFRPKRDAAVAAQLRVYEIAKDEQ